MSSFRQVLLKHGFKRSRQYHKGIVPYSREPMYCEVYTDDPRYAWAIGGDLKSSPSYPGGYAYWKPEDLDDELRRVSPEAA